MAADLILVGCTATKLGRRAPAADLYMPSDLFRRRRGYAEASGRPWAILSALHGIVDPARELDPYNFTIGQRAAADWAPADWARMAIRDAFRLAGRITAEGLPDCSRPLRLEVHAGVDYVRTLALGLPAFATDITIDHPVAGLGIGQQKAHYTRPVALPAFGQLALAF